MTIATVVSGLLPKRRFGLRFVIAAPLDQPNIQAFGFIRSDAYLSCMRYASIGARGRTRTGMESPPRDFKSLASTSFATRARQIFFVFYLLFPVNFVVATVIVGEFTIPNRI